jgi:hypothetical protein
VLDLGPGRFSHMVQVVHWYIPVIYQGCTISDPPIPQPNKDVISRKGCGEELSVIYNDVHLYFHFPSL